MSWIYDTDQLDPPYESSVSINWDNISKAVENLATENPGNFTIGLLNFNMSEVDSWQQALPDSKISVVALGNAESSVTWEKLYPEWIDEEEEEEIPSCPTLPDPKFDPGIHLMHL